MNYIKSMKGLPLWPYEDVDLLDGKLLSEDSLRKFVLSLRDHVDPSILNRWTEEALTWAVESRSRHLSCRSIQVLKNQEGSCANCGDVLPSNSQHESVESKMPKCL